MFSKSTLLNEEHSLSKNYINTVYTRPLLFITTRTRDVKAGAHNLKPMSILSLIALPIFHKSGLLVSFMYKWGEG